MFKNAPICWPYNDFRRNQVDFCLHAQQITYEAAVQCYASRRCIALRKNLAKISRRLLEESCWRLQVFEIRCV